MSIDSAGIQAIPIYLVNDVIKGRIIGKFFLVTDELEVRLLTIEDLQRLPIVIEEI